MIDFRELIKKSHQILINIRNSYILYIMYNLGVIIYYIYE